MGWVRDKGVEDGIGAACDRKLRVVEELQVTATLASEIVNLVISPHTEGEKRQNKEHQPNDRIESVGIRHQSGIARCPPVIFSLSFTFGFRD